VFSPSPDQSPLSRPVKVRKEVIDLTLPFILSVLFLLGVSLFVLWRAARWAGRNKSAGG
jgi:hypothetical protein